MAKKYKLKTHRGAKKRFHLTKKGRVMRMKGLRSHLRRKKSPRSKRQFSKMIPLAESEKKRVRRVLGK